MWRLPTTGGAQLAMALETDVPADQATGIRDLDPEAWDALFVRLYPRLVAYAARRVSLEAARDVASETFSRAIADVRRFEPGRGGPEAWIFGICRHVLADQQRSDARRSFQPLPERAAADPPPAERLIAADERAAVRAAFGRLRRKDRDVLELRVVAQLDVEQVARLLHKRPGAIRTAQSRALARLRSILQEEPA